MSTQVTITSVIPLNDKQKSTLVSGLKKKYSDIEVVEKIDPSILGGLKVTVGSRQYDASVSGKLSQLKQSIK
jgi:F-type H+-transporting ATPase subunit delta